MYRIQGFTGPRELGRSGTVYLFIESDGPVHCNVPMCHIAGDGQQERYEGSERYVIKKRNFDTVT